MSNPPFDLSRAIERLRDRCTFSHLRAIFEQHKLSPGSGWEALQDKIDPKKNEDWGPIAALLAETYQEQLLLGPRALALYVAGDINWKGMAAKAAALSASGGPFASAYPVPLPPQVLKGMDPTPYLVEVRPLSAGDIALVFSSSRSVAKRETYQSSDVAKEVRQAFGEFQQLIVVNNIYYQAYDVLVIRSKLDRLELRLDTSEMATEVLEPYAHAVLEKAETLIPGLSGAVIGGPLNLFPAVDSMYRDKEEGSVVVLGFQTHTASIKRERMRRKAIDLRLETFHHAGVKAVKGEIEPYYLTIAWRDLVKGAPDFEVQLTLPGHIKNLAGAGEVLPWASVTDCSSEAEFRVVANKIISHCP
jgi:hypothetical protein